MSILDGLIAATAIVHGLIVVTRNVSDIARTGLKCVNPFTGQGSAISQEPPPP